MKNYKKDVTSVPDEEISKIKKDAYKILKLVGDYDDDDDGYNLFENEGVTRDQIKNAIDKIENFQKGLAEGSGLSNTSSLKFIFLPISAHELCNRLRILLQEKTGGNNNPQINQEIMAISDKFLEYEIITTEQHENMMNTLL